MESDTAIRDGTENGRGDSLYPYYPLSSAIKVGEAVKDLGGVNSSVPKSILASHLGEPEKSPGLQQKIASAKCFGIIEGKGTFTLSNNGKRYFFPTAESERAAALLSFLTSPPAFSEVVRRFDGSKLPSREILANIFHREARVPDSWKERIAGFFAKSVELVGALDPNGFLRYKAAIDRGLSKSSIDINLPSVEQDTIIASVSPTTNRKDSLAPIPLESTVWDFSYKGKNVRIITPTEMDEVLWSKLDAYIKLLKPTEAKTT